MENILSIKTAQEGLEVEYSFETILPLAQFNSKLYGDIEERGGDIDLKIKELENLIGHYNDEIERMTNHADMYDYMIAVSSGLLCGAIDSFFVGAFDFEAELEKAENTISDLVSGKSQEVVIKERVQEAIDKASRKAKIYGKELSKEEIRKIRGEATQGVIDYFDRWKRNDTINGTQEALKRSISKLEQAFKIPSDNLYHGLPNINAMSHHLDDIAHHPTSLGLCAAIISEVFRIGVYDTRNNEFKLKYLGIDNEYREKLKSFLAAIVVAGLISWILNIVDNKYHDKIEKTLPKPLAILVQHLTDTPIVLVILTHLRRIIENWIGHLISDVDGSNSTPGAGMGIPGFFVSVLNELSMVPPLSMTSLHSVIEDLFVNKRVDFRKEMTIYQFAGKQSLPVLLGDVFVRSFYFIRYLVEELKIKNYTLSAVDWKKIIPFNNRTILRMMTIESGTFTSVDLADAAIRSAIVNGGNVYNPKLYLDFALRVNIVGIGRFAIALGSDIHMGYQKGRSEQERINTYNQLLYNYNAKVFFLQSGNWLLADQTEQLMKNAMVIGVSSYYSYMGKIKNIKGYINSVDSEISSAAANNPEMSDWVSNLF